MQIFWFSPYLESFGHPWILEGKGVLRVGFWLQGQYLLLFLFFLSFSLFFSLIQFVLFFLIIWFLIQIFCSWSSFSWFKFLFLFLKVSCQPFCFFVLLFLYYRRPKFSLIFPLKNVVWFLNPGLIFGLDLLWLFRLTPVRIFLAF